MGFVFSSAIIAGRRVLLRSEGKQGSRAESQHRQERPRHVSLVRLLLQLTHGTGVLGVHLQFSGDS